MQLYITFQSDAIIIQTDHSCYHLQVNVSPQKSFSFPFITFLRVSVTLLQMYDNPFSSSSKIPTHHHFNQENDFPLLVK